MARHYSTETMERYRPEASKKKSLLVCVSMFSVRRRKAKEGEQRSYNTRTYSLVVALTRDNTLTPTRQRSPNTKPAWFEGTQHQQRRRRRGGRRRPAAVAVVTAPAPVAVRQRSVVAGMPSTSRVPSRVVRQKVRVSKKMEDLAGESRKIACDMSPVYWSI